MKKDQKSSTVSSITQKALDALDSRLDQAEFIETKDLKDIALGLLSHSAPSSRQNSFLASSAAQGAVLGALEGLAKIAGKPLDRNNLVRNVTAVVGPDGEGDSDGQEEDPYERSIPE